MGPIGPTGVLGPAAAVPAGGGPSVTPTFFDAQGFNPAAVLSIIASDQICRAPVGVHRRLQQDRLDGASCGLMLSNAATTTSTSARDAGNHRRFDDLRRSVDRQRP